MELEKKLGVANLDKGITKIQENYVNLLTSYGKTFGLFVHELDGLGFAGPLFHKASKII